MYIFYIFVYLNNLKFYIKFWIVKYNVNLNKKYKPILDITNNKKKINIKYMYIIFINTFLVIGTKVGCIIKSKLFIRNIC